MSDPSDAPLSVAEAAHQINIGHGQWAEDYPERALAWLEQIIARVAVPEVERLRKALQEIAALICACRYTEHERGCPIDIAERALAASGKEDGHGE